MDHNYLRPWLSPLGDCLHLVHYDHRCNGRSGRPPLETLTLPQLCADADALRERLGFEKVAVFGHSYGGFIAIEYALRFPQRISHLVLAGTSARFDPASPAFLQRLSEAGLGGEFESLFRAPTTDDDSVRRYLRAAAPLYYHTVDPELADRLINSMIINKAAFIHGMGLVAGWDVTERLGGIRLPTLIIAGRADVFYPPEDSSALHSLIAHSDFAIFERSGHFPFVEQAEEFTVAVRTWLARH